MYIETMLQDIRADMVARAGRYDIENIELMIDWSLAIAAEVGRTGWPGFDRQRVEWFVAAFVLVMKLVGPEVDEIHPLSVARIFKPDIDWDFLKKLESMTLRIVGYDLYGVKCRQLGCSLI